jgi:hypothetical protein
MFLGFGRVLIVVLILGSLPLQETRPSFRSKVNPVGHRYLPLSETYRQKIQEKIEASFVMASALSISPFSMDVDSTDPVKNGTSGWLIPYGDPVFGSISLQL